MSVELDPPELGFKRQFVRNNCTSQKEAKVRIGPFQQEVTQTLKLKNNHSDPVAFKVSTPAVLEDLIVPEHMRYEYMLTDPGQNHRSQAVCAAPPSHGPHLANTGYHRYCVRPNSGRIEPGDYVEVSSMIWPFLVLRSTTAADVCRSSPSGNEGRPAARCEVP